MVGRLTRSLGFRLRRLIGRETTCRSDVVSRRQIKNWRNTLRQPSIELDLEVRGPAEAMNYLVVGSGVEIDRGCIFWFSEDTAASPKLTIGNGSYIGPNCYLGSHSPVTLGENVLVGAFSYIISANHCYSDRTRLIRSQGYDTAPIIIEDDVWIGCHVTILPGVEIGRGAVVAAGAVVSKSIPEYEVWGGVPAKFIKTRGES